ncbi:hypothetical protein [Streptomyces sp. NPDC002328]|uniref:hypothetical protein n=1 Tax=Streptomyces sp. NPDC002328 TaxID=3364642 RepID=UPI0036C8E22B
MPGPTDVRLVGVLDVADDEVVRAELADSALYFQPHSPRDLPAEIADLLPAGAEWVMSERVNQRITEDLYPGYFAYDRRSGQVLFDCWNPHREDGPPPSLVAG